MSQGDSESSQPSEFHFFGRLPAELQFNIWEIAILDHNRDRLVPVLESTKRVIPTRYLTCSPVFHATYDSRKIATRLYPIRLPVSQLEEDSQPYDSAEENPSTDDPKLGVIWVSGEHDIFVLVSDLLRFDFLLALVGGSLPKHCRRRTASLTLDQIESVRQLMVLEYPDWSLLNPMCHFRLIDHHCIATCDVMTDSARYGGRLFTGVQKSYAWYLDLPNIFQAYWRLLVKKRGMFKGAYLHHDGETTFGDIPISLCWNMNKS